MNIDLTFKVIIGVELVGIALLFGLGWRRLMGHWQTTLAGSFVILASIFINAFCYFHLNHLHDPILAASMLAIGIGQLIAADAK